MKDDAVQHDPLDQLIDEQNEAILEEVEGPQGTDTAEVMSAEEAAMNIDNDTAMQADAETGVVDGERDIEAELVKEDQEIGEVSESADRKHKNRESTAEKAKRSTRQSTSEKAKLAEEERKAQLDPLRLRSKKYRAKVVLIDRAKVYSLEEAVALVKETSTTSFDSAVELHCKVKGEAIRGTITLPNGNGKTRKVALATDDVIESIAAGTLDFDVLVATPAQMPKLARYAKVLGPKGLMPSPKAGTVTDNPDAVIAEINGGRVEYRADKTGVVHLSVGKVSFPTEKLVENIKVVQQALVAAKPQSLTLASTMGPGVKVSLS